MSWLAGLVPLVEQGEMVGRVKHSGGTAEIRRVSLPPMTPPVPDGDPFFPTGSGMSPAHVPCQSMFSCPLLLLEGSVWSGSSTICDAQIPGQLLVQFLLLSGISIQHPFDSSNPWSLGLPFIFGMFLPGHG